MPNNDLDVFDHLTSNEQTRSEIDFFAYAIFAFRKKEWVAHFEERYKRAPNQDEIDNWIAQQPDFEFNRMRGEAADYFDSAAKEYLAEYIEAEKKKAVDASILSAVEKHISPTRDALIALVMAIMAPVILGGMIFMIGIFDSNFPVHISIGQHTAAQ